MATPVRPYDIRKDIETLIEAHDGKEFVQLWNALVVAAVSADDGNLQDSNGNKGYAWTPDKYHGKHKDPVGARLAAAAASLGRMMFTGRGDWRTLAAYMEAAYVVTVESDYDTAARIEELWDLTEPKEEIPTIAPLPPRRRKGIIRRFFCWVAHLFDSEHIEDYDRL